MHHLISHHLCPFVQRAVIVLLEKDIEHERTYIDLANKPDWFKSVSPLGKVPLLKTGGTVLFESQVIAEYLDEVTEGSLHPSDPLEKARHRSWIEFGSEILKLIVGLYTAPDKSAFEAKGAAIGEKLERLEAEIKGPYFSGDSFHMIDGVWGTIFRYFDVIETFTPLDMTADLPKVSAWRSLLSERPSIINATPEGYTDRLKVYLKARESYLSTLVS
ncbi:MAG: glutathione S-transferase family protein [Sneathiella sp.]